MSEGYDVQAVEAKWQQVWEERGTYQIDESDPRPKFYDLCMYPYPSGPIHMGHVRNYTLGDVLCRYKTMQGFGVLSPMGWDSFGLPAENAAIAEGIHPQSFGALIDSVTQITLSHNLSRELPPDFVNVPCDFWLRVYWLTYGAIVIYLLCFVVRLLWVLRRDPRSRLTADLFIIASGLGVVSFAVLLTRIINPGLVAPFWIWTPSCVAGGLAAFAAAWSWRERMRPRSRRRPPPGSTRRRA